MKINGVVIRDESKNVYFSYIKQFPGICAQADSFDAVTKKIERHFKVYMEQKSIEFEGDIETL